MAQKTTNVRPLRGPLTLIPSQDRSNESPLTLQFGSVFTAICLGLTILTAVYARRPPFLQELEVQEFGGNVDVTEAVDFLKQGGLKGPKGRDENDEKLRKLDFSNFDKDSTQGESNSFYIQNDKKDIKVDQV